MLYVESLIATWGLAPFLQWQKIVNQGWERQTGL